MTDFEYMISLRSQVAALTEENRILRNYGDHGLKASLRVDALEKAANEVLDFYELPWNAQRPDVLNLRLMRLANALRMQEDVTRLRRPKE